MIEGADQAVAERHRPCGYSGCDQLIPYAGRGRPREYCERVWPDGQSCQQKADQQRAAAKAAGLDGPLIAYRHTTETIRPALDALGSRLAELLETLRAVETGALERISAAEAAAVAAEERAEHAERERDTALARATTAEHQRREALEAQRGAERRVRDAEKNAEDTRATAWRQIAEHDHQRGQAEAARDAVIAQFAALTDQVDKLDKYNQELSAKAAAAEKAQAVAEATQRAAENTLTAEKAARNEATTQAVQAVTRAEHAEAELAAAQRAIQKHRERASAADIERAQLAASQQRLTERDAEIQRLRAELEQTRHERDQAHAHAATALTHEHIAEMIRAAARPIGGEDDRPARSDR